MSRLTLDPADVQALTKVADDLLASWRATLTAHTASPQAVAWSIEDAVNAYPGLGLEFEACEGGCGRHVHGADPDMRLVVCDECKAEAKPLTEHVWREILRGGR